MRYYAKYTDENQLVCIGIGYDGVEISESEYNALLVEIQEKAGYENALYYGEILLSDIPADWQEEIQQRVDERIARKEAMQSPDAEISDNEALDIMLGVSE